MATAIADLTDYLAQTKAAIETCDWDNYSDAVRLLSVRDSHAELDFLQLEEADQTQLKRTIPAPFDRIVGVHLRVCWQVANEQFEEAYKTQAGLISLVAREVIQKIKEDNWFLPIVYRFCSDIRLIAKAADAKPKKSRSLDQSSFHEQSAASIMECYRNCVSDIRSAPEVSKRLAILNLTNQLFRIYFRINKLNLLKPLIRAVDNSGAVYDHFSIAEKVTYQYYVGRKAMFDSDLKTAEKSLAFAFRNCPAECEKNKRLVLTYLIPVKMFLGHMPTEDLLQKYDLTEFSDVAQAVKQGNLLKLEEALVAHEAFFIKCGIFLMLEKLKIITYRTLFKKVCRILDTHQVPLEAFLAALEFMEVEDIDQEEVACITANLIYQGKIKGYISHQHQKLVISKQNPFPALSSVAAAGLG